MPHSRSTSGEPTARASINAPPPHPSCELPPKLSPNPSPKISLDLPPKLPSTKPHHTPNPSPQLPSPPLRPLRGWPDPPLLLAPSLRRRRVPSPQPRSGPPLPSPDPPPQSAQRASSEVSLTPHPYWGHLCPHVSPTRPSVSPPSSIALLSTLMPPSLPSSCLALCLLATTTTPPSYSLSHPPEFLNAYSDPQPPAPCTPC